MPSDPTRIVPPADIGSAPGVLMSGFRRERFVAATFTYDGTLSAHALSKVPVISPNFLDFEQLLVNGVDDDSYSRVSDVPSGPGQWKLAGGVLQVYGDVRASGDVYKVSYAT